MGVQVLDCTLRDGGYINNWEFGRRAIASILDKLEAGGIDIIECGFLTSRPRGEDCSLFRAHGLGDDLGHSKLEHAHGDQNACVDLLTDAHRHHITVLDPCLLQAFHIDGFCHKCIIRVLANRLYFIFVPVNGDHILARL